MAGFGAVTSSLGGVPGAFTSSRTAASLSAEAARRDARLYDVLSKGLERFGADSAHSTLRKKPTFFRRGRGASVVWDSDANMLELRRRLVDAGELAMGQEDYGNHPLESVLARFLRARKGSVDDAYDQFVRMAAWRREEDVDSIFLEDFPERHQIDSFFVHYILKTDRLARPVFYLNLGGCDLERVLEVTTAERFLRYDLLQRELAMRYHYPRCWQESDSVVDQNVNIVDLKGFTLRQFSRKARELMTRAAYKDQEYYPEMLGKAFVINAPASFRVVWALLRTLVDKRTQDKVTVLGKNYEKVLTKHIHPDNLPAFLGGTQRELKINVVDEYIEQARADLAAREAGDIAQSAAAAAARLKEDTRMASTVGEDVDAMRRAAADAAALSARIERLGEQVARIHRHHEAKPAPKKREPTLSTILEGEEGSLLRLLSASSTSAVGGGITKPLKLQQWLLAVMLRSVAVALHWAAVSAALWGIRKGFLFGPTTL